MVDGCDTGEDGNLVEPYVSFAIPKDHSAKEFLTDGGKFDPCNVYVRVDEDAGGCLANNFDNG